MTSDHTTIDAIDFSITDALTQRTPCEDIWKCLQVIPQTKYVGIKKNTKTMYMKHIDYLLNDGFRKLYVYNNARDYRAYEMHGFFFYETDSFLSDASRADNYGRWENEGGPKYDRNYPHIFIHRSHHKKNSEFLRVDYRLNKVIDDKFRGIVRYFRPLEIPVEGYSVSPHKRSKSTQPYHRKSNDER